MLKVILAAGRRTHTPSTSAEFAAIIDGEPAMSTELAKATGIEAG